MMIGSIGTQTKKFKRFVANIEDKLGIVRLQKQEMQLKILEKTREGPLPQA